MPRERDESQSNVPRDTLPADESQPEGSLESESLFHSLPYPAIKYDLVDDEPVIRSSNTAFTNHFDIADPTDEPVAAMLSTGCGDSKEITAAIREQSTVDRDLEWVSGDSVQYFACHSIPRLNVLLFADVTEREEARRQFRERAKRFESFASVVSHDLRNPLDVAEIRIEAARETGEGVHFEKALAAIDRMERIIQDVRSLTVKDEEISDSEAIQLTDVAKAAWDTVDTPEASIDIKQGEPLEADKDYLQQLLENLFRNGVEHAGPDVTVTVTRTDGGFAVSDDGPGIGPDEREDVLEAGFTTADQGTGLGLAIVQRIAAAHGWSITVTESESGGACFEFSETEGRVPSHGTGSE